MTDTLPEFLLHWAERTPDAVCVTEPDRGRTFTYREYDLDRAAKHVDGLVTGR